MPIKTIKHLFVFIFSRIIFPRILRATSLCEVERLNTFMTLFFGARLRADTIQTKLDKAFQAL